MKKCTKNQLAANNLSVGKNGHTNFNDLAI
jgi:hypothetical protein